ncbi:MAG TPA: hypothetical protein P5556_05820 [Candidatus Gastranaerophilales bacterium]|nr:hypothetical protein [Candidatus Gastranaerophilales bacterium]
MDMSVWLVSFSFFCFVFFLFAFKKKENEETASVLLHTGKMLKQVQHNDFHVY